MTACSPNCTNSPVAASTTKRLLSCISREKPRSTMKAKSATMREADDQAQLLAGHGEDEIGMRVGQIFLHRAFAGAAAPQAAIA